VGGAAHLRLGGAPQAGHGRDAGRIGVLIEFAANFQTGSSTGASASKRWRMADSSSRQDDVGSRFPRESRANKNSAQCDSLIRGQALSAATTNPEGMGAARTEAGVLASIRALPTLPRLKSWRENSPKSADKYDSIPRRRSIAGRISWVACRRPRPRGRAQGGLMSEPPKSACAKACRICLPSLCKFDDLLGDYGRSFVSAVTQLRSVACHPVRRAHGLNDLRRKTPIC
jgi:hypothetical protein